MNLRPEEEIPSLENFIGFCEQNFLSIRAGAEAWLLFEKLNTTRTLFDESMQDVFPIYLNGLLVNYSNKDNAFESLQRGLEAYMTLRYWKLDQI